MGIYLFKKQVALREVAIIKEPSPTTVPDITITEGLRRFFRSACYESYTAFRQYRFNQGNDPEQQWKKWHFQDGECLFMSRFFGVALNKMAGKGDLSAEKFSSTKFPLTIDVAGRPVDGLLRFRFYDGVWNEQRNHHFLEFTWTENGTEKKLYIDGAYKQFLAESQTVKKSLIYPTHPANDFIANRLSPLFVGTPEELERLFKLADPCFTSFSSSAGLFHWKETYKYEIIVSHYLGMADLISTLRVSSEFKEPVFQSDHKEAKLTKLFKAFKTSKKQPLPPMETGVEKMSGFETYAKSLGLC